LDHHPRLPRLASSGPQSGPNRQGGCHDFRIIDRWFDELVAWEPYIDVLANLPDNF
jgi:hypothetical protein